MVCKGINTIKIMARDIILRQNTVIGPKINFIHKENVKIL